MAELGYAVRRMNEVRKRKQAMERESRRSAWPCPQCGSLQVYRHPQTTEITCEEPGCTWRFTAWEQYATLGDRLERLERLVEFVEKRVREVWQRAYLPDAEREWVAREWMAQGGETDETG